MSPLRTLGPYQVGHLIGRGGQGEVFAGFDPRLGRPVAIKRLAASQGDEALLREARYAARLSHPGIVRIYDLLQVEGADHIIFELVDGVSLREMLHSQASPKLPLERALEVGTALAGALAYAHDRGVLHRDIKAANVLICKNGDVKLTDFGVATSVGGLGIAGAPVGLPTSGTLSAMSPEQTLGEYTDARSDLFSLGVLLYELLTGISPFFSPDPATCLRLVREGQTLPITERLAEVPVQVSKLVDRLLAKRRSGRPESAREVEAALTSALSALRNGPLDKNSSGGRVDRQLAVACVVLDDSSDSRDRLQRLDVLHEAVARAGGTMLASAGPRALFCIGYPVAQESACELAIQIVDELARRAGMPIGTLKAGVDCGPVTIVARSQAVLAAGAAVDDAVRIADVGEPGCISVTLAVQTLARRFFRFAPLAKSLPSRSRDAPLYRVLEAVPHDVGIEQASTTPLRGRSHQLEQLDRAFEEAQRGVVVTRLVVGGAGVGKSRLLHEWRKRTGDRADLVLAAYANSSEQYAPFVPLVRLWRRWFGLADGDAEAARAVLALSLERTGLNRERFGVVLEYLFGISSADNPLAAMPGERRRQRIIEVLVSLLMALAEKQSVVVSFEDLHYVDRSTLEVVQRLAENPRPARLSLILAARPEFLGSWPAARHIPRVDVDSLSATESLLLIESLTGGIPLPAGTTRALVEHGDGVPLVLEELTRAVVVDASRAAEVTDGILHYPTSLADSVARRVEELGAAKELIRAAAALGRESPVGLLRAIVGVGAEEFRSRLQSLQNAELVRVREMGGQQWCVFSHALVEEAISSTIPAEEMRTLRTRIVAVLDEQFVEGRHDA